MFGTEQDSRTFPRSTIFLSQLSSPLPNLLPLFHIFRLCSSAEERSVSPAEPVELATSTGAPNYASSSSGLGGGDDARRRDAREGEENGGSSVLSILRALLVKMLLCCCWPIGKCATVLAYFDTCIVAFFAYKSFSIFMETANDLHWTTIISLLFFVSFLICHILGSVFICLAARRKIARYCLPRLVLIAGLTVCSLIVLIFMVTYFAGSAQSVNAFLFRVYEYFFATPLTDADKVELKHELRYYGVAFFLLAALFFIYNVFALWLTIKFKQSLNDFEPVPTEPTAPQLAHNPAYAEPPLKSYPNMA